MDFWIKESHKELQDDVRAGRFERLVPRYTDGVIVVGGRPEHWMQSMAFSITGLVNTHVIFVFRDGKHLMY